MAAEAVELDDEAVEAGVERRRVVAEVDEVIVAGVLLDAPLRGEVGQLGAVIELDRAVDRGAAVACESLGLLAVDLLAEGAAHAEDDTFRSYSNSLAISEAGFN